MIESNSGMERGPLVVKKSAGRPRRCRRAKTTWHLVSAVVLLNPLWPLSTVYAGSATWRTSPVSGDWNSAINWSPTTSVPNGAADTATFATSSITAVSLSANTEVNGIVFNGPLRIL